MANNSASQIQRGVKRPEDYPLNVASLGAALSGAVAGGMSPEQARQIALANGLAAGGTPANQSAAAAQRGVGAGAPSSAASGGTFPQGKAAGVSGTVDPGTGDKPTGGTTKYQQILSAYDSGVTEPWTGTAPTAEPFSYADAPTYGGSGYDQRRDRLLDRLEGSKFSYDPAGDPVWQAYQKQYRREGQRATEDALGRAAASTGGVASSYAAQAASQAGNYYAAQLSDRLPQMYQDAYNRYLAEYERQLGLADTFNGLGRQDYDRYRDTLNQFNTDRNFAYGVYSDDYARARQQYLDRYQEYLDEQDRRASERKWAYDAEQAEKKWAWDEDQRDHERALEADKISYDRGRDSIEDRRYDQEYIDALRQYDDRQAQQQWENAYKLVQTVFGGVVPEGWISEALGIPAGTYLPATGSGSGGGTGGGRGSGGGGSGSGSMSFEDLLDMGLTEEWEVYDWFKSNGYSDAKTRTKYYLDWLKQQEAADQDLAQNIRNAQSTAEVMGMLRDLGQRAGAMPAAASGERKGGRKTDISDLSEGYRSWWPKILDAANGGADTREIAGMIYNLALQGILNENDINAMLDQLGL